MDNVSLVLYDSRTRQVDPGQALVTRSINGRSVIVTPDVESSAPHPEARVGVRYWRLAVRRRL